jgi:DNA-binding NarL/FixJ family response regulator
MGDSRQLFTVAIRYCRGVSDAVIRVVIVDDHGLHRDGTRRILDAYEDIEVVAEAGSGEEALAVVNRDGPDVVLMDIGLPGMNGIDTARRIRTSHPDVCVLMVTAYDDEEYVRGALEAGATGYLPKTAPGRDLVDAIRSVVGGSTVIPSELAARLLRPTRVSAVRQDLTGRELEVLRLVAEGLHNKEIARRLAISSRTVDRHCDNIYEKLGVASRTEAVVQALSRNLLRVADVSS